MRFYLCGSVKRGEKADEYFCAAFCCLGVLVEGGEGLPRGVTSKSLRKSFRYRQVFLILVALASLLVSSRAPPRQRTLESLPTRRFQVRCVGRSHHKLLESTFVGDLCGRKFLPSRA